MDVIQRNFIRLLRAGAFTARRETIEPMSPWKWQRLEQLALLHEVAPLVYQGMLLHKDDFFIHMPDEEWREKSGEMRKESELLSPTRLTNPLLNKRLQSLLNAPDTNEGTRKLALLLVGFGRHLLNAGISLRLLADIGATLRQHKGRIDNVSLQQWTKLLKLTSVARLAGQLLVRLFEFKKEDIPFVFDDKAIAHIDRLLDETFSLRSRETDDWYFTQGKNIFIQTSNSQAMFGQLHHSMRYFGYYPAETVTNFFASFAHSLSHIEE